MLYDSSTGHRVKEPYPYVSWAHSELRMTSFHLRQCLFGEHLLGTSDTAPVMLVESEKTAHRRKERLLQQRGDAGAAW